MMYPKLLKNDPEKKIEKIKRKANFKTKIKKRKKKILKTEKFKRRNHIRERNESKKEHITAIMRGR